MIKELKYLFFIISIVTFFILSFKYYFSDANKKNSHRSLNNNNKKIINFSKKLILLESNTKNIVQYVEKVNDQKKKNYNFWKLINVNDK